MEKLTIDSNQRKRDVFNYYRNLKKYSIEEIAEKAGYSTQYLYNILSNGSFTEEAATKIASVLGCKKDELLSGQIAQDRPNLSQSEMEIITDERLWFRMMLLSQQRTIENLSYVAKIEKSNP